MKFTNVDTNKDAFFYLGFTDPGKSILQILERCLSFVHSISLKKPSLRCGNKIFFYSIMMDAEYISCHVPVFVVVHVSIDIMDRSVPSAPSPKKITVRGISTLQIKNLQISSDLTVMLIIVEKISVDVSCFV